MLRQRTGHVISSVSEREPSGQRSLQGECMPHGRTRRSVAQAVLALDDPSDGGGFGGEGTGERAKTIIVDDVDSRGGDAKTGWRKIEQLHSLPKAFCLRVTVRASTARNQRTKLRLRIRGDIRKA